MNPKSDQHFEVIPDVMPSPIRKDRGCEACDPGSTFKQVRTVPWIPAFAGMTSFW